MSGCLCACAIALIMACDALQRTTLPIRRAIITPIHWTILVNQCHWHIVSRCTVITASKSSQFHLAQTRLITVRIERHLVPSSGRMVPLPAIV
jgi:hypothetical protein